MVNGIWMLILKDDFKRRETVELDDCQNTPQPEKTKHKTTTTSIADKDHEVDCI